MESLYDVNISMIKGSDPALYSDIIHLPDKDILSVIDSRNGDKVPEMHIDSRRIYVHSKFDPVKEAQRFVAEVDPEKNDLFIVMGFGFAYHIEELLSRIGEDTNILVLEKNPWMIREAITHRDLTSIMGDNRVKILVDPEEDEIAESLKGKSTYRVSFLTHRGSFQIYPEYYSNIRNIARSHLSTKEVNIATLSRFEKTWSSNIARNIKSFVKYPGANIFFDKFKDFPAIVVAAGPSFTHSIEFIRRNANKAIIIAVDTAYSILKRNGIEPHFCITVDPQIVNARYFEGDVKGSSILVADPTIRPSVFHLFKGNIVVTGMAFQMMKWIEEVAGERGELAYGGSVTTNAYDFAKRLGASPVVLIGQDLAFTDGLAHARGSYLDEEVHLRINRFYNAHMFNRYQLTALPGIYVDGIRAKKVPTNQKMMIFISWFEKRNDPDLINATYDGALLKGVKHSLFEDINFSDPGKDILSLINEIYNTCAVSGERIDFIANSLLEKCEGMYRSLDSMMPILERSVSLSLELVNLMKSKKRNQGKLDYILKKLSEADRVVETRDTLKDMISFTIQRVIHTITEGYEIDEMDENLSEEELVAKRSHYLYKGLLEGSLFNKKILKKMMALLSG